MADKRDFRMGKDNPCLTDAPDPLMAVLDGVMANLPNDVGGRDERLAFLEQLTPGQQAFLLTMFFEGEVCNGGFCQFFFNSTGDFAHEIASALRYLGAHDHLQLLEQAMSVFGPEPYPTDRQERNNRLDKLAGEVDAKLSELDNAFYSLDDPDRCLQTYWEKCVKEQPDQFFR